MSLKGMHNCCREVVPIFRRQGGGKIVNVSSVARRQPGHRPEQVHHVRRARSSGIPAAWPRSW